MEEKIREVAEFRVAEKFASLLFADGEGKRLGNPVTGYDVRKVELDVTDPRFAEIGRLQAHLRATKGKPFYTGWHIKQIPTAEQIRDATLFRFQLTSMFEPSGEVCGTLYDESSACPFCGAGAAQLTDLRLDMRKAPKSKHLSQTIARGGERVISQKLAEMMVDAGLTGFELRQVRHKAYFEDDPLDLSKVPTGRLLLQKAADAGFEPTTYPYYVWVNREENHRLLLIADAEKVAMLEARPPRMRKPMPIWYQLIVNSAAVEMVPPTRIGIGLFDDDVAGEHRCPLGDTAGLNMTSSVTVNSDSLTPGLDIQCSRQYVGTRRGLIRPSRLIFISPRFASLFRENKFKGADLEIVNVV